MKLLKLKFKIIIGIALFIVLVCAGYSTTIFNSSSGQKYQNVAIGKIVFNGKFLTPVENFKVVTSKYGSRIHPISRKAKFSYWYRFSRKCRK
ncbi:MAG: hypothetical protein Q4G09_03500 [Clostridia bacterium]|nr:hypothetical protein [Clostridia bacterium]